MQLVPDAANPMGFLPAMPPNLFDDAHVGQLVGLWNTHITNTTYYETSFVHKWKVNNVPLKPAAHKVSNPKWRQALRDRVDDLDTMHPRELMALNIGSNIGLARVVRRHYEDRKQDKDGECKTYSAFNVDCNIFDRIIKVNTCA